MASGIGIQCVGRSIVHAFGRQIRVTQTIMAAGPQPVVPCSQLGCAEALRRPPAGMPRQRRQRRQQVWRDSLLACRSTRSPSLASCPCVLSDSELPRARPGTCGRQRAAALAAHGPSARPSLLHNSSRAAHRRRRTCRQRQRRLPLQRCAAAAAGLVRQLRRTAPEPTAGQLLGTRSIGRDGPGHAPEAGGADTKGSGAAQGQGRGCARRPPPAGRLPPAAARSNAELVGSQAVGNAACWLPIPGAPPHALQRPRRCASPLPQTRA